MWGPQTIAKLVYNYNNYGYGTQITMDTGVMFTNLLRQRGHHIACIGRSQHLT